MARGGRRAGTPGKAYGNRADMNTAIPKAGPSQAYGERAALERAQQAVPMSRPQAPAGNPTPVIQTPARTPRLTVGLGDETQRPDEPLTSGARLGPGPGPEALGFGVDPVVDELRAMYARFPSEELRELLEDYDG